MGRRKGRMEEGRKERKQIHFMFMGRKKAKAHPQ